MGISIQLNERGLIRVFAVNRSAADLNRALRQQDKETRAAELLGHPIAKGGAELFPVADLTGVGLSGYLAQGYAVPEEQLKEARARLDALSGYVLLVFSSAFQGRAATLTLGPDLTLIGTFGEAQPDMTPLPLESDAAHMQAGAPPVPSTTPKSKRPTGSLLVVGLIVLAGLVLWWTLR